MAISVVSFSFSWCSNGGLGAQPLWDMFSFRHLLTNWSDLQTQSGVPRAPSAGWWLSLSHLSSNFSGPQLTDFLSSPSYIIVQSPTQSLEWHVWSSSSGNNCHAVHRSLLSGASVCDCTAGFYLVPFCQPSSPTPMEYALPPSLESHVWSGRRSIYNSNPSGRRDLSRSRHYSVSVLLNHHQDHEE